MAGAVWPAPSSRGFGAQPAGAVLEGWGGGGSSAGGGLAAPTLDAPREQALLLSREKPSPFLPSETTRGSGPAFPGRRQEKPALRLSTTTAPVPPSAAPSLLPSPCPQCQGRGCGTVPASGGPRALPQLWAAAGAAGRARCCGCCGWALMLGDARCKKPVSQPSGCTYPGLDVGRWTAPRGQPPAVPLAQGLSELPAGTAAQREERACRALR